MRESLERLLRDLTLVTLVLAIAIGWSLIQVAEGFAELVAGLLYELPDEASESGPGFGFFFPSQFAGVLVWNVGGRVLTLGALVAGLVQLGVVLVVAAFVYRRSRPDSSD